MAQAQVIGLSGKCGPRPSVGGFSRLVIELFERDSAGPWIGADLPETKDVDITK